MVTIGARGLGAVNGESVRRTVVQEPVNAFHAGFPVGVEAESRPARRPVSDRYGRKLHLFSGRHPVLPYPVTGENHQGCSHQAIC